MCGRCLKGPWWLTVLTVGSFLKDVRKLSGKGLECVGKVSQGCLKGALTVFQGCLQVFSMVSGRCQEGLSQGCFCLRFLNVSQINVLNGNVFGLINRNKR